MPKIQKKLCFYQFSSSYDLQAPYSSRPQIICQMIYLIKLHKPGKYLLQFSFCRPSKPQKQSFWAQFGWFLWISPQFLPQPLLLCHQSNTVVMDGHKKSPSVLDFLKRFQVTLNGRFSKFDGIFWFFFRCVPSYPSIDALFFGI